MRQRILEFLEPKDVYDQAYLPKKDRSFRMRVSDMFWKIFMSWDKQ